jgi:hypothetical protein
MNQTAPATLIAALLAAWSLPSVADSTQARCEIYPKGSDKMETMVPCTFGQRQGHITITRQDGVTYDLSPVGDRPRQLPGSGRARGPSSERARRGGADLPFPTESLIVYWDTAASAPAAADNPTAPFATKYEGGEYDATTLLRCKTRSGARFGQWPGRHPAHGRTHRRRS